jgi:hypothetical protein
MKFQPTEGEIENLAAFPNPWLCVKQCQIDYQFPLETGSNARNLWL